MTIALPAQYSCYANPYGPGMDSPRDAPEGPQDTALEIDLAKSALCAIHIWNLGELDGPYPFDLNTSPTGTTGDWVLRARHIARNLIRPLFDAARPAGLSIVHNASPAYASRYASYLRIHGLPEYKEPRAQVKGCIRPFTVGQKRQLRFGNDYPGHVSDTHRETFDIAACCRPTAEEQSAAPARYDPGPQHRVAFSSFRDEREPQ